MNAQTNPNLLVLPQPPDYDLSLLEVTMEDRLRGLIIEALFDLERGAFGRAQQVLEDALTIKPKCS